MLFLRGKLYSMVKIKAGFQKYPKIKSLIYHECDLSCNIERKKCRGISRFIFKIRLLFLIPNLVIQTITPF